MSLQQEKLLFTLQELKSTYTRATICCTVTFYLAVQYVYRLKCLQFHTFVHILTFLKELSVLVPLLQHQLFQEMNSIWKQWYWIHLITETKQYCYWLPPVRKCQVEDERSKQINGKNKFPVLCFFSTSWEIWNDAARLRLHVFTTFQTVSKHSYNSLHTATCLSMLKLVLVEVEHTMLLLERLLFYMVL
jgi:hypothetical protein